MTRRALIAALLAAGGVANAVSKWVLVWLFSRSGGAEAVGIYSLVLAVATPLFVLAQWGLRTILLTSPRRVPWKTYLVMRIGLHAVAALSLLTAGLLANSVPIQLVTAVIALKVADSFQDLCFGRMQFDQHLLQVGVLSLSCAILTVPITLLTAQFVPAPEAPVWAAAGVSSLFAIACLAFARRSRYVSNTSFPGYGLLARLGLPVALSQVLSTVLFQIPILALSARGGAEAAGVYAGAAYLLVAASLIGSTMITILVTPLRQRFELRGGGAVRDRVIGLTQRLLGVGFVLCIPVVTLGSPVLVFVYGGNFAMGFLPLLLLGLAATATLISFALNAALNVLGAYSSVTRAMVSGILVSAGLGLLFAALDMDLLISATAMSFGGAAVRTWSMWRDMLRHAAGHVSA